MAGTLEASRVPPFSASPPVAGGAKADDRGDEQAFRDFFRREFAGLSGYCYRLTGDRPAAEDLAQEALVRTWARWTRVNKPREYAFLVATNLTRRRWRRERPVIELTDRHDRATPGIDVDLGLAVDDLPKRLRTPVLLHYYADLPVVEIARLLRCSETSVRSRLAEARRRLATVWGER
ncbi:MAG: RNA polymerase sigma factor [Frankia sp.]